MAGLHRRAGRWRTVSVACAALAGSISGCYDAGGITLSTLNQSDHAVVLEVVADKSNTFVLPAHSYTGLYSGRGQLSPAWHVRIFDATCHPVVDQPMTIASGLLYIGPDGAVSWKRGTEGATGFSEIAAPSATACPG